MSFRRILYSRQIRYVYFSFISQLLYFMCWTLSFNFEWIAIQLQKFILRNGMLRKIKRIMMILCSRIDSFERMQYSPVSWNWRNSCPVCVSSWNSMQPTSVLYHLHTSPVTVPAQMGIIDNHRTLILISWKNCILNWKIPKFLDCRLHIRRLREKEKKKRNLKWIFK